jgi:diadenosine tetraphosphate (Ap4A) HIT family hydrolase
VSPAACPACDGSWPSRHGQIADLGGAVLYLNDDQFFRGWTFLVWKRHATELFQLTADERRDLMESLSRVAKALADEYAATKVNYELLGNQVAHIHWHVVPRCADDPAPRGPVWTVGHEPVRLGEAERAERVAALRRRLSA